MSVRGFRSLLVVVAISTVALGSASAAGSAVRVLVVKLTWGPQPVSASAVDAALQSAETFYATSSFGQISISYEQSPWLNVMDAPPVCNTDAATKALPSELASLARGAGYDPSRFDRVIYLFPQSNCPYPSSYQVDGILLNGQAEAPLVVHELGHSLGMGHAGSVLCRYFGAHRVCREYTYGDPWDVMGAQVETNGGAEPVVGDVGALQKARAGWITPVQVTGPGVYQVAELEQPQALPQALVVQTAGFEYWIDHREDVGNDADLQNVTDGSPAAGFEVHRISGSPALARQRQYPLLPDYLLPQGRQNRYVTSVGQTFTLPNVFSLVALSRTDGVMSIRFRWLDHTKPTPPAITSATVTASGEVAINWRPSGDTGTGVQRYLVSLDDGGITTVPAQPPRRTYTTDFASVLAGRHKLTVTAVDYAGNSSRAAARTLAFG